MTNLLPRLRVLVLFALCALPIATLLAQLPHVREVRVLNHGPGPLDDSSVRAFVSIQPGENYNPGAVNRDVRTLQETGRFSEVTASLEVVDDGAAVDVVYELRNRPRLRRLQIEGGRKVSNRRIRDLMELELGHRLDDQTLAIAANKVRQHYRRRYFTNPGIRWTLDVDERTGGADVTVRVDEGDRTRVQRIYFEGNEHISAQRLRRIMTQRSWRPWSWITKSNRYDPYALEADRDLIRREYMNRGHLDVVVGEPVVLNPGASRLQIHIPIEEGPVYRIGQIDLDGLALFSDAEIRSALHLHPGDIASMATIEQARSRVRDFYGSRGYIRTGTRYRIEPAYEESIVDVEFVVREGELSFIRDIHVRGNTRTKDKVIRRELAVLPGDIFDEVRVRRSENRLRNMGFFSMVRSLETSTPEPHVYDLTFDVEEGRTGQLTAGVAFSSIDRVVGFAEISQNNFDLFGWPYFTGGGQKIQLRTQIGSRRNDVELNFVEPWFLDRQLSLDVNLFRRDIRFYSSDYEQQSIGGNVGLARPVGRNSRIRLAYGFQEIDIRNVRESASDIIKEEAGRRSKSAISLTLTRDTRDHFFVPTRGSRTVLSGQLAGGVLMGDTDLYGFEASHSHFVPLWFDHVFSLRGSAEVVEHYGDSDRVPIFDRLFLGGGRNIRGFRFRDVGPKDERGEPIGGKSSAFLSAEYTIPLLPNIRFATFYDVGMVWPDAYEWDTHINSAYGIGVRFDIPGFPLRFDYAWPQETDEFNDRKSGRFSFMLGHVF